jgi:hypothetical protein
LRGDLSAAAMRGGECGRACVMKRQHPATPPHLIGGEAAASDGRGRTPDASVLQRAGEQGQTHSAPSFLPLLREDPSPKEQGSEKQDRAGLCAREGGGGRRGHGRARGEGGAHLAFGLLSVGALVVLLLLSLVALECHCKREAGRRVATPRIYHICLVTWLPSPAMHPLAKPSNAHSS